MKLTKDQKIAIAAVEKKIKIKKLKSKKER